MLKILLLNLSLLVGSFSFAQESTFDFHYNFSITGITECSAAKTQILKIRDLMGVQAVRFDDTADRFTVLTNLEFDVEELLFKLITNGIEIDGEIVKIEMG